MYLVVVLRRALKIAEQHAGEGERVGEDELADAAGKADDEGHDQEVGEKEQVFPGPETFHIVHDGEVKVEIQHGQDPGQLELSPQVEMIRYDEEIGRREVDQGADKEAETEVGDDADKMRNKDEENELVEPDRLFPFSGSIVIP
jgi:hypothetical protein